MPLENRPAQTNRGAPVAASRRPFHLRLPDVFAPDVGAGDKPVATPVPEKRRSKQVAGYDPTARVRAQLSEKRFQDGQQQVTGMIERMRERRRKLFDRLWVASIALTALSIVALAVELIQGTRTPTATRVTNRAVKKSDAPRQLSKKISAAAARPVSPAGAREWSNTMPDDQPVTSALYTTEDGSKPRGAWLDGLITNPDSDSDQPSRGVQHDDHQSRTP